MDPTDRIRVIGPEPAGLAEMLASIVRGNVQRHPERLDFLEGSPGVVRITAVDAEITVSLEFRDGELRIYSGPVTAPPDVSIDADSETLVGFSAIPQLGPVPNPFTPEGRTAIGKAARGQIKIRGLARGRKLLDRMRGLLTTDPA